MISRIRTLPKRVVGRARRDFAGLRHRMVMRSLMNNLHGVIHVGANLGQERDEYDRYCLNVLWIEPIPWIFNSLQNAISAYPRQRALEYLVLDRDGETRKLHVANNGGASSSILDLSLHREVWPTVHFTNDIEIAAYKLDTIIARERVALSNYDGLVLDTQGSELLVLKGAGRVLEEVKMVKTEVADFEAYAGCPTPQDVAGLLDAYGFCEWRRVPFAWHATGGRYYDIVYLKNEGRP